MNGPGGATSTHAKEDVPEVGLLGELGDTTVGAPGLECDVMPVVVVPGDVAVVGVALGGALAVGMVGDAPGDATDTGGPLEIVLTGEG